MIFYKINPIGVASEQFGNEVVLMNLYKGNYYCFRGELAIEIWKRCELPITSTQLVASFALSAAQPIEFQAIESFFNQLIQEGLLIPTPPVAEAVVWQLFSPTEILTSPILEIYEDMQELILLDPIHDVDAEEGWPTKK